MNIFSFIKNILFPPGCVLCDFTMEPNSEGDICGKCAESISFCSEGFCCEKCGKPIVSFAEKQLCYFCVNGKSKYFDRIVSVFEYEGVIRDSILRYKQMGIPKYAGVYAKIMSARFYEEYEDTEIDFICAAPSHRNKRRDKDFDGVEEICRRISGIIGIEHKSSVLVKVRKTAKQSSLNYEMRSKNLTDSMRVREGICVEGKRVLLIDDVCTTRATIMECAKTLKKAGAKKVYSLTLATTMKEETGF